VGNSRLARHQVHEIAASRSSDREPEQVPGHGGWTGREQTMRRALSSAIAGMTLMTAAPAVAADGQAIYAANCAICHKIMKPELGDKAAWEPLIKRGEDALVASVIHGNAARREAGPVG